MPAKKIRRFKNTKKISSRPKRRVIIKKTPLVEPVELPTTVAEPTFIVENAPVSESPNIDIPQPPIETVEIQPENIVESPTLVTEEEVEPKKETDFLYSNPVSEKSTEVIKTDTKRSNPIKTVILSFLLVFLGIVIGGLAVYFFKPETLINDKDETKINEEQAVPTATPTEALIDFEKYSISILNGSLTKGGAGKLKTELEDWGFIVASTGNATSSAFKETVIMAKKSVDQQYLKELEIFLSKKFVLAPIETLLDSKKTDVVITIGGKTP